MRASKPSDFYVALSAQKTAVRFDLIEVGAEMSTFLTNQCLAAHRHPLGTFLHFFAPLGDTARVPGSVPEKRHSFDFYVSVFCERRSQAKGLN